jgi:hypothetical protein
MEDDFEEEGIPAHGPFAQFTSPSAGNTIRKPSFDVTSSQFLRFHLLVLSLAPVSKTRVDHSRHVALPRFLHPRYYWPDQNRIQHIIHCELNISSYMSPKLRLHG